MSSGKYVWHDLFTTDPEAAQAFYGQLFGWEVKGMPMPGLPNDTYDMLHNQGEDFGGCMGMDPSQGGTPRWTPYITVPDTVDAAVERAAAKGGTVVMPPMDIPDVGRFAMVRDPDGTLTNPFSPIDNTEVPTKGTPPLGAITWNEIWVNDLERGKDFYSAVYGWSIAESDMGGDVRYFICNTGDQMRGGFGATGGQMPATTVFYVLVADLDASAAKVAELGGQTEGPIIEIPDVGRIQWARDPQGTQFCLHEDPK